MERVFGHIKQNLGLREFLTRGLNGVRAEFGLACIAHNLKRIWKIQGEMECIGVSCTKSRRFDLDLGGKNGMVQLVQVICARLAFMSESLRREATIF